MLVKAYTDSGTARVPHELDEGDIIEWKHDGARGFKWARAVAVIPDHPKVKIRPLFKEGSGFVVTGARERWISLPTIMAVYDSQGRRKNPA